MVDASARGIACQSGILTLCDAPVSPIRLEEKISIVPRAKALTNASRSIYTNLTALGEILDNALEAVAKNRGKKLVVIKIDLDARKLTSTDNGHGCYDAAAFHQIGRGRPQRSKKKRPVTKFCEYFQASCSFSRHKDTILRF
jgi:hypothetical protein